MTLAKIKSPTLRHFLNVTTAIFAVRAKHENNGSLFEEHKFKENVIKILQL